MLNDFSVEDLPNVDKEVEGLPTSPMVLKKSAAPSDQPLPLVVDSALVAYGQERASLSGELPLTLQYLALPPLEPCSDTTIAPWIVYIGGSCNKEGLGISCLIATLLNG